jgi:hypothetical protein
VIFLTIRKSEKYHLTVVNHNNNDINNDDDDNNNDNNNNNNNRNIIIVPSLLSPFVVSKRKISILSIQLTFYMFPTFHFYNCIAH